MRIIKNIFALILLFVLGLFVGCEKQSEGGADYTFSCRYLNEHSDGDECVEYHGEWTLAEVEEDCYGIFGFLDETTAEVGTVACDVETECVGSCIVDKPGDKYVVTRYYVPVDAELLESFCENPEFGNGAWEAGCGGNSAPPQTVSLEQAARDAMVSDGAVDVVPECLDDLCESAMAEEGEWIEFTPTNSSPTTAFVIYPGGGVDARAYAPPAREIAEKGYLTVIVPMPGKFALDGYDRIDDVIAAHSEIEHWYLGGHSLGGAAATRYESESPGTTVGLILWAAYGSIEFNLSDSNVPVTVIHGSEDGLATVQDVEAGKPYLPADSDSTRYISLEGANHAQFGFYGEQAGDGEATITKEKQQELLVKFTTEAIERELEDD
jgi:hypothetical protein